MSKKCENKCEEKKQDAEQTAEQAVNDTESAENSIEKELEQVKAQLEQTKETLLRTAAEFDNFKKRETANREKAANFVKGETIKALLPSIDNINRAMSADSDSPEYAKGVEMTIKGLVDALNKLGLVEINPVGEEFDVNLHQAVMRVEDDSVGENIVTEVLQTGYMLGDTVLRHAMVKVANCD